MLWWNITLNTHGGVISDLRRCVILFLSFLFGLSREVWQNNPTLALISITMECAV